MKTVFQVVLQNREKRREKGVSRMHSDLGKLLTDGGRPPVHAASRAWHAAACVEMVEQLLATSPASVAP
jgi:hypothetical protein